MARGTNGTEVWVVKTARHWVATVARARVAVVAVRDAVLATPAEARMQGAGIAEEEDFVLDEDVITPS